MRSSDSPLFGTRPASAAARAGRCFRTHPDGRIALTSDWPALFAGLQDFPALALQLRHAFARLIMLAPLPRLAWQVQTAAAHHSAGDLTLDCAQWGRAWGLLQICDCCGAPGRVEVQDRHGGDFLEICADPGCAASNWSDYLARVAAPFAPGISAADAGRFAPASKLPRHARWLGDAGSLLPALLDYLGNDTVPLRCSLRLAGATLTREFIPEQVDTANGLLTTGEPRTKLQLALPCVRGLAVTTDASGHELHAAGADESILLSFSASADPEAAAVWHRTLASTFTALS